MALRSRVVLLCVVVACLGLPFRGTGSESRSLESPSRVPSTPSADAPVPLLVDPTLALPDWLKPESRAPGPLLSREHGGQRATAGAEASWPDWLERVDLSVQHGSEKPRYYIETVQPLYQSLDQTHTLFVQPRLSYSDDAWTANFGLGYRQLLLDQQLLGGINSFYDYTDDHNHYRLGLGLELMTLFLELRTNGYFPLSETRKIRDEAGVKTLERALTGADVELGGQVPYLPFLKLYGSYAYYDYDKTFDSHISKARAEVRLTRGLRLDLEGWNDNKAAWEYRIGVVFTMDFERPLEALAKPSAEPYPYKNMRHMTVHRVVREHQIKVERYQKTESVGVTVVIARGD